MNNSGIALITVSFQTINAALNNSADSLLRYYLILNSVSHRWHVFIYDSTSDFKTGDVDERIGLVFLDDAKGNFEIILDHCDEFRANTKTNYLYFSTASKIRA